MSWFNASWSHRTAILVDKLTAGVATVDVTATIPTDLEEFWDNVLASGNDVRVTDADGRTLEVYDLAAGFDTATRTGVVEVQAVLPPIADSMMVLWLYYGNSGAADARTAFAPAAARTGYIYSGMPVAPIFKASGEEARATAPRQQIAVTPYEGGMPWFDVTPRLTPRYEPYEGRRLNEEISYVIQKFWSNAGADQGAYYQEAQMRIYDQGHVRCHFAPIPANSDWAISLQVGTTLGRVVNPWVKVRCRDLYA